MAKINSLFSVAVILTFIVTYSLGHPNGSVVRHTSGGSHYVFVIQNPNCSISQIPVTDGQRESVLPTKARKHPRNCADLYNDGDKESGIRTVYPSINQPFNSLSVYCDHSIDGGGWTVFQHRINLPKQENFYRLWRDYQQGFGKLTGEFWLGLDNIHTFTKYIPMELRVDLEDFDGKKAWAKYNDFAIDDGAQKYRLYFGSYFGTAGNSLRKHNKQFFSTADNDNDEAKENCAKQFQGGWWYEKCYDACLNNSNNRTGTGGNIAWAGFTNNTLKYSRMSLRPKNF